MHIKNKKYIYLDEGPTDNLDDTTLTAEEKYSVNFTEQQKKFYYKFPL